MSIIDCNYSVTGSGPAIFLTHGVGGAEDAWRFIVPKLKDKFTVVTYDLRGHGKSPVDNKDFNLDDLVLDLERVREKANIEKAHFMGHSLGGMIAPAYAKKFPERVLSVGLLSTVAGTIGILIANTALRAIIGKEKYNEMLVLDLQHNIIQKVSVKK